MGYSPDDFQKTWVEIPPDPTPPRRSRGTIAAIIMGIVAALCVCGISSYLTYQTINNRTTITDEPAVQVPTPIGGESSPAEGQTPDEQPTDVVVPPTVTIPNNDPATTVTPPIKDAGNIEVPRFANPPTLDGNLGEWGNVPSVESRFQVYNVADWDNSDDITALWQMGWDITNLYVAVTVQDDTHAQNQWGETMYKGDSVELQLDTDRAGDYGRGLSPDDFQFILSPGNFTNIIPSIIRFRGTNAGNIPVSAGHQAQIDTEQTSHGYTIEAFIPWGDLDLIPQADMTMGASLNVNDNDRVGQAVQEVMKSHVSTRQFNDPTSWGTITLR